MQALSLLICVTVIGLASPRHSMPEHLNARTPERPMTRSISFLNEIEPILTRAGCNQGACHGSQFGKGGFKLSLAAYDPDLDYESIVRQARGRRANFVAPTESL